MRVSQALTRRAGAPRGAGQRCSPCQGGQHWLRPAPSPAPRGAPAYRRFLWFTGLSGWPAAWWA